MNKEEQINALEAQVKQQHPSWNNDDIRNQAVRMFYMDTTTVMQIIKMIENKKESIIQEYIKKGINEELAKNVPKVEVLRELEYHLQEYIEGQVSAMENSTGE
jgi:hypothetical protein